MQRLPQFPYSQTGEEWKKSDVNKFENYAVENYSIKTKSMLSTTETLRLLMSAKIDFFQNVDSAG